MDRGRDRIVHTKLCFINIRQIWKSIIREMGDYRDLNFACIIIADMPTLPLPPIWKTNPNSHPCIRYDTEIPVLDIINKRKKIYIAILRYNN